jgi:phosphatidylserine decarboxylase
LKIHRSRAFLRAYSLLPHRLLNRSVARLTALERPRFAVQAAIRAWARLEQIELDDFEDRAFLSIDDFFLRRLRPGARPLGPGFVSPVDGRVVAAGALLAGTTLLIKGQRLSLDRVINAGLYGLSPSEYSGGSYAVLFLSPRGYHRVHAPERAELLDVRWIPGRYFPQNEQALEQIPRVYERNERAVLRFREQSGLQFLLVMVGASLVGGIHLEALPRAAWARRQVTPVGKAYAKGDEIGHFAFGSTVVLLLPNGFPVGLPEIGRDLAMGQRLAPTC